MDDQPEIKEASEKMVNAAEVVKNIVSQTVDATFELQKKNDEHMTSILSNALREVFDAHKESGRFVDVSRVPLLCKSIIDMQGNIKDIINKLDTKFVTSEAFWPVRAIAYGLVGIIMVSVVGALLMLIMK
mgnify:FL=1